MPAARIAIVTCALGFVSACSPKFESSGGFEIDGAAFRPNQCHALVSGGVELSDPSGARLELAIPPNELGYGQDVSAAPSVKLQPGNGKPEIALGTCGTLSLHGESFHGNHKRAVSGSASLSCSSGAKVSGSVSFSGCF